MLTLIWSKCWKVITAIGVLLLAFGSVFLVGMRKGSDKQQAKVDEAEEKAEVATQAQQILETRHEIDAEVQKIPSAPAQRVGDADPSSAAGMLREIAHRKD